MRQAPSALVYGKEIILQIHGLDKYGRAIADVLLTDVTNRNQNSSSKGGVAGKKNRRRGMRCWNG